MNMKGKIFEDDVSKTMINPQIWISEICCHLSSLIIDIDRKYGMWISLIMRGKQR